MIRSDFTISINKVSNKKFGHQTLFSWSPCSISREKVEFSATHQSNWLWKGSLEGFYLRRPYRTPFVTDIQGLRLHVAFQTVDFLKSLPQTNHFSNDRVHLFPSNCGRLEGQCFAAVEPNCNHRLPHHTQRALTRVEGGAWVAVPLVGSHSCQGGFPYSAGSPAGDGCGQTSDAISVTASVRICAKTFQEKGQEKIS